MTFQTTYRIYLGEKAFVFLTLEGCQREQRYQQQVNGINPVIYEVVTSYQGEAIVNTEERALPGG